MFKATGMQMCVSRLLMAAVYAYVCVHITFAAPHIASEEGGTSK